MGLFNETKKSYEANLSYAFHETEKFLKFRWIKLLIQWSKKDGTKLSFLTWCFVSISALAISVYWEFNNILM